MYLIALGISLTFLLLALHSNRKGKRALTVSLLLASILWVLLTGAILLGV